MPPIPVIGKLSRRIQNLWLALLRRVLNLWVRPTVLPEPIGELGLDPDQPVFYMFDSHALSSLLIVEQICLDLGWSRPSEAFEQGRLSLPRSYGANRRYRGLLFRRLQKRRHSALLKQLIDARHQGEIEEIQIVPVSVLIGRAPDKEVSLARILFSENWDVGGRLRRLLSTFINGRATFVQFGQPVSLNKLHAEGRGAEADLRRLSRMLRVHFKRVRTAAIGPDRSHRRTLIEQLLRTEIVRHAIAAKARRENISQEAATEIARKYAMEIAADYSYTFVRVAERLLTWFWNRIYRGVDVFHFNQFREAVDGHEVIYVPCHRSHIDYMILSYILYHRGFVPPHIAAGVNLNMPLIGPLLRRGGAFFLRRSFRSQPLYASVFNEYVETILSKGVALEYFIEGTRSRTGRLLPPKAGMLSITVRAYLRNRQRSMMFQPVYIGYERLAEGNAYISELSGQRKKPESLSDFRNLINILRKNYGRVQVSFGEPILLDRILDRVHPEWPNETYPADTKPPWLQRAITELADQIMRDINRATHVNPINLLAVTLLATRKQALDEQDLEAMIEFYQRLIPMTAYSDRVTVTELTGQQVIDYGIELGLVERLHHKLGDIIRLDPKTAVLMTYFRNNVAHLLSMPAWIACCFLNNQRVRNSRVRRLTQTIYPFLAAELFLPWSDEEVPVAVQRATDSLIRLGLLSSRTDYLQRAPGGADQAYYLRLLGNSLLQTFERYYITIAVLAKNGSGRLSRQQLEQMCMLSAQRISLLHEFDAPEFSDRTLFRQFIDSLQQIGILTRSDDGSLHFDHRLEALARDAKLILDKEIRHSIIQVAPQVLELKDPEKEAA